MPAGPGRGPLPWPSRHPCRLRDLHREPPPRVSMSSGLQGVSREGRVPLRAGAGESGGLEMSVWTPAPTSDPSRRRPEAQRTLPTSPGPAACGQTPGSLGTGQPLSGPLLPVGWASPECFFLFWRPLLTRLSTSRYAPASVDRHGMAPWLWELPVSAGLGDRDQAGGELPDHPGAGRGAYPRRRLDPPSHGRLGARRLTRVPGAGGPTE